MRVFRSVKPSLQSGALSFRVEKDGRKSVLLVTTSRSGRWSIPKGAAEPHLSLAENAAKEAFEEAGVVGEIAGSCAGKFHATKRTPFGNKAIEVWVYPLRVTEQLRDWPEKRRRRTKWVSCKEAAKILSEPLLVALCRQLENA